VTRAAGDAGYVPPRPLATWAFRRYFRNLAAKHFTSIRLASLDEPARWERDVPTLFLGNHTTWWDGIIAWLLMVELGLQPHVLMEAVNLERYAAFKWIGTLPVRRDSLRGAYEDLQRALAFLRPGTGLWIFPQGHRKPVLQRPDALERGAAQLALGAGRRVRIVPVAFRYPFLSEQLPEGFVLVGEPWFHEPGGAADRRTLSAQFGERLARTVEALDARLAREDVAGFRPFIAGRPSINKRMDLVRHRLGLLRGDFEARNG
jgi:1-acyl-sn-glycerol-3-phosphate acyltransferase